MYPHDVLFQPLSWRSHESISVVATIAACQSTCSMRHEFTRIAFPVLPHLSVAVIIAKQNDHGDRPRLQEHIEIV